MGGQPQEVIQIGGQAEPLGVVGHPDPGARTDQGGLVRRRGSQQQRAAVGVSPAEGRGAGGAGGKARRQLVIAPAADQKVGQAPAQAATFQGGPGLRQHLGAGRPVVAPPEQEPLVGRRKREALVHGPEDPGGLGVLAQPAEAPIAQAEGLKPGPVFFAASPVDACDPPVSSGLGLERGHQPRQQPVGIAGGHDQMNRE